jgi:hypothetical protein
MNGDGELSANADRPRREAHSRSTRRRCRRITTQAVPPVRRGDLYLSFLAGGGAIADFGWTIDNPLAAIRSMSLLPPSLYPDTMEFGDAQAKLTGTIPKRIAAGVDIDAVMAATTFAAKARYKSSKTIAATAVPVLDVDRDAVGAVHRRHRRGAEERRRHGDPRPRVRGNYDETAGYDVRITIVNSLRVVATYP